MVFNSFQSSWTTCEPSRTSTVSLLYIMHTLLIRQLYSTVQFTKVTRHYSLHILCQSAGSHLLRQLYITVQFTMVSTDNILNILG
jgi:hypothetical protein